jgi:hypothetical protein
VSKVRPSKQLGKCLHDVTCMHMTAGHDHLPGDKDDDGGVMKMVTFAATLISTEHEGHFKLRMWLPVHGRDSLHEVVVLGSITIADDMEHVIEKRCSSRGL